MHRGELGGTVQYGLVKHEAIDLGQHAVDLQEDGHAGDVVDGVVVLAPFLSGCLDDGIACLLGTVLEVEWPDDPGDILI